MKIGVSLKMLQNAIEQQRLFAGQKGHYLDATVFIDIGAPDQYGNHGMITQDVTKEEKAQGVKGNILGNCKVFWCDDANVNFKEVQQQQQYQQAPPMQQPVPQYQQQAPQQQYQQAPQPQQAPNAYQQAQGGGPGVDDIPFSNYELKYI